MQESPESLLCRAYPEWTGTEQPCPHCGREVRFLPAESFIVEITPFWGEDEDEDEAAVRLDPIRPLPCCRGFVFHKE